MNKEPIKCPHCGNDDPSMIEKLEPFQGKHYKWDVMHDKFLMFLCLVCTKEF